MAPKRKADGHPAASIKRPRLTHFQDARTIATQSTGNAVSNGELDVNKFVKAREFEIRALEAGMKSARKTLTARAFQGVPRELRRRTASHNVKRVPKRLQKRARKEMDEDNTPTVSSRTRKPNGHKRLRLEVAAKKMKVTTILKAKKPRKKTAMDSPSSGPLKVRMPHIKKNALAKPPKPKAKFRKRQNDKTWLPTHLFHTKRARMTPPSAPLWKMSIPLSPTQKSYRVTHRASSSVGAMAWDTSYLSTIALHGTAATISAVFKALGVGSGTDEDPLWWVRIKAKRWLEGTRIWNGWLYEANDHSTRALCPATIIWDRLDNDDTSVEMQESRKRQALVRVHPATFLRVWENMIRICKQQRPMVAVEDLRFEIGSIEVCGPASTEALVGILKPSQWAAPDRPADLVGGTSIWSLLKGLSNPSTLPADVLLGFDISDPRLRYPPRIVDTVLNPEERTDLLHMLTEWPLDKSMARLGLFDRSSRISACRTLPSQKSVNRRKGAALPGAYPEALPTDPVIPIAILPNKSPTGGGQGSWSILLPWKCVLPVWSCLMHHPLSTGSTVRFGGLDQLRQVSFEASAPWFPGDHPGTAAGKAWEEQEAAKRKSDWEKRPKSKRVAWESIDLRNGHRGEIGFGWACDWSLLRDHPDEAHAVELRHMEARRASRFLGTVNPELVKSSENVVFLATVEVSMLSKGVSRACARIYRLPSNNAKLKEEWLALARYDTANAKSRRIHKVSAVDAKERVTEHDRRQQLARSLLLEGDKKGKHSYGQELALPDEVDLIGFVTSGNFNLSMGSGSSIGSVAVERVRSDEGTRERQSDDKLCIVRDSGEVIGRLARWRLV